jgi:hypothetical protein
MADQPTQQPPDTVAAQSSGPEKIVFHRPARVDRWAHRRGEPRTLAAAWVLYLLAALVLSLGSAGARGLVWTDVYRASSQVLMVLVGVGIGVLWPMLRLSQEAPHSFIRCAWTDSLVVGVPVQAVIWPQFLPWMAAWPFEVVAALAAHATAWVLLVAGWISFGLAGSLRWGWERWQVMLTLIAIETVGPLVALFRLAHPRSPPAPDPPDLWLTASPLTGGWEIVKDRSWMGVQAAVNQDQWMIIMCIGIAAALVWSVVPAVQPHRWPPQDEAP